MRVVVLLLLYISLISCSHNKKESYKEDSKVFFNHTYFHTLDKSFVSKLESVGFVVDKMTTEHPGGVQSHFVFIGDNMPGAKGTHLTPAYLEFGYISNKKTYEKKYGKYQNKKDPESLFFWKGYSMGSKAPLKVYAKSLGKELKFSLKHKNYDWKNNNTDPLPGWDFLTFDNSPFDLNFFTWFTESHKDHPRKNKKYGTQSNGALRISGIIFDFKDDKEKAFLESLTGSSFTQGRLVVDKNHIIYDLNQFNPKQKKLLAHKMYQYKAVIVEFSKGTLEKIKLPYEKALLFGKKVKILRFNKRQWDLLMVEGRSL